MNEPCKAELRSVGTGSPEAGEALTKAPCNRVWCGLHKEVFRWLGSVPGVVLDKLNEDVLDTEIPSTDESHRASGSRPIVRQSPSSVHGFLTFGGDEAFALWHWGLVVAPSKAGDAGVGFVHPGGFGNRLY